MKEHPHSHGVYVTMMPDLLCEITLEALTFRRLSQQPHIELFAQWHFALRVECPPVFFFCTLRTASWWCRQVHSCSRDTTALCVVVMLESG